MESYNSFLVYEDFVAGTELYRSTMSRLRENSYIAGMSQKKVLSNMMAAYEMITVYKKMDTSLEGHLVEVAMIYGKEGVIVGYRCTLNDI